MGMSPLWLACVLAISGCRFGFDEADRDASGSAVGDGQGDGALLDCTMTHPTALFCDGFEGATMAPWDYQVVQSGTVQKTTGRAYRGSQALAITSDNSGNTKFARWGHILSAPITTGDIYLRVYYWMTSGTNITDVLGILVAGNGISPFPSTILGLRPGELTITPNGNVFPFTTDFPRDRWVCVEMHVSISSTIGFAEVTFDGTPNLNFRSASTNTDVGGYTNIEVGVQYANPLQDAVAMWADEVVFDTAPLGCN
jgi:hypothetical protein